MMNHCTFPDTCNEPELKQTHISWIVLTDNFAFKIKRPVKYSFLDFSSSENREFYCRQEIKLNRRTAPDMYLKVIEVSNQMAGLATVEEEREVIDHAVQMKRMDNSLEMDIMLANDEVTEDHIIRLADKVAAFHKKARVLKNAFATLKFQERYADIKNISAYLAGKSGSEWEGRIDECVSKSFKYLNSIRNFTNQRIITGFQRNCHGDLNASNVFLYNDPVIYDCIEFNSDYRRIDVLNDIAFLCVDLDFFGKREFSDLFYRRYLETSGYEDNPASRRLFDYYKSYRAGVRAKVILNNMKENPEAGNERMLKDAQNYILMMEEYLGDF